MSVHRNPNAKPYTKPQTGSARRGNANANTQARNRLTNTLKTVSAAVSNTIKQTVNDVKKASTPKIASDSVAKIDYTKLPQNIHKGYNSSFKPVNTRKQQFDLAKRMEEQREQRRKHTLEYQIDAEIQKVTTTGKNTKLYNKYSKMVNAYWDKYVYNVDPEAFRKWYNANVVKDK